MMGDRRLWLLLAAGLAVRLALMPLPDPFDADLTTFWLPWMAYGAEHGLAQLYQHGQPLVNYPPLYLALLIGLGKLYGVLVPGFEYTPLQSVLIKLPAVAADLAITVLLYYAAARLVNQRLDEGSRPSAGDASAAPSMTEGAPVILRPGEGSRWLPLMAAGLWALNPAVIYVSAYWAQVDSIHTLWMLAALLAALGGRWGWSGALMGLALLSKLHAVVLLPLLFVLALRYNGRAAARTALGMAGALALGLLPLALGGALRSVATAYFGAVGFYPLLSANAYNGWFLVQSIGAQVFDQVILDTARVVGPVTLRWIGLGLLAGYTAAVLALLWPHLEPGRAGAAGNGSGWLPAGPQWLVFGAAGLLFFGFFSLPTEMHERYGLPALAFLALPAARQRRVLWPYLLLTAVWSFNLVRVLPWGPGILNLLRGIPGDRLLASLASVALFIWLTVLYLRAARSAGAKEEPQWIGNTI